MSLRAILTICLLFVPAAAWAQPAPVAEDSGYCDYVEGTASANAATLVAPTLFGQFGYIEQPAFDPTLGTDPSNLRMIAGMRYSLTNIYAGLETKARAAADCKRHKALIQLQALQGAGKDLRSATLAPALTARARVLEEALPEAERILKDVNGLLEARQTTAQAAMATRMRVEELRGLASTARRQLAELPAAEAEQQKSLGELLTQFRVADAEVEKHEGKLRSLRAYELSVRAGIDRFLDQPEVMPGTMAVPLETRYFAVVELGINLGALFVGSGNKRSRSGRSRYALSQYALLGQDVGSDQVRAALDVDVKRTEQVSALVADLEGQLKLLASLQGDDTKRFREVVWFDYIKAKAELAYLQAHVQAARQLIGGAR